VQLHKANWAISLSALLMLSGCVESSGSGSSETRTGQGGSTARFAIVDQHLYALRGDTYKDYKYIAAELQMFDLMDPAQPIPVGSVSMDFDVETLFAYKNYLFIGGQSGMYIYDNIDPANPQRVSQFVHARGCDPVVVQGDFAYVTLNGVGTCGGAQSVLDVVDIANVAQTKLLKTVPMQAPHGLAVAADRLYVCDGQAGLKTFDIAVPAEPKLLGALDQVNCNDLIHSDGRVIATGDKGLFQYDMRQDPPLKLSELLLPVVAK
jgi:hypothetical protein